MGAQPTMKILLLTTATLLSTVTAGLPCCLAQEPPKDLIHPLERILNIRTAAFSSDGLLLAAGAGEMDESGQVTVWDVPTLQVRFVHKVDKGVPALAFSRDNKTLAVCTFTQSCHLLDTATGKVQGKLAGHGKAARGVAFAPDGQTLAVSSYDGSVRLWDYRAGKLLRTLPGHTDWVYCVAYSPDGTMLASSSADNSVRLWDPSTGKLLLNWKDYGSIVRSVAFDPKGQWLATACWDGTLKIRDPHSHKVLAVFADGGGADWVAVHPSGQTLAACRMTSTVDVLAVDLREASGGQQRRILALMAQWEDDRLQVREQASQDLHKLGWMAEPLLAKAQKDSPSAEVRMRARQLRKALRAPTPVARLKGHHHEVLGGAYSADGRLLATTGKDGRVLVWDTATYQLQAALTWPL
jgi:WD40 repeat protein